MTMMKLILAALFVASAQAGYLCCGNPCASSSECSAGMYCCPYHHVCMDISTHSTAGPVCGAYCCQDSVLGDGEPDPRCPYLADKGYCSDPKYGKSMAKGCPKSCGLCPGSNGVPNGKHTHYYAPKGMLGVSAYNDHYYCNVKSACWKGEGNLAVLFESVGDGSSGPLADPMESVLATDTEAMFPASEHYTHNEATRIAGELIFSGVPKSGMASFFYGNIYYSGADIHLYEVEPCVETIPEALAESSSPEASSSDSMEPSAFAATLGFFAGIVVAGAVVYRRRHAAGHLEQPFVALEA